MTTTRIATQLTITEQVEAEVHQWRVQFANITSIFLGAAILGIVSISGIVWLLAPQYTQLLALIVIATPLLLGAISFRPLHARGYTEFGINILMFGFISIVFTASFTLPALIPPAAVAYIVIVVLSNVLIKRTISIWFAILSVVGLSINVLFSREFADHYFIPLDPSVERILTFLICSVAMAIGSLLVRYIVMAQSDSFRSGKQANIELQARIEAEQHQREQLREASTEVERRAQSEQIQREQLQHLIVQVQMLINNLNAATSDIQTTTARQLSNAVDQGQTITHTATAVEEIRTTVQQAAGSAQIVADNARQSVEVSRRGETAVNNTLDGMQNILHRVEDIARTIQTLDERTLQISEIIESVNDLADQSKMLALNASIEAARAGDEGRGFAIVAMEVRELAEQSRQATARITAILKDFQQITTAAVKVTGDGSKEAEQGIVLATRAGEAIRELAEVLADVTEAAALIASSTQQQANSMDQLSGAMSQIKRASEHTAEGAQQTDQRLRNLKQLTNQLDEATSRYEIRA